MMSVNSIYDILNNIDIGIVNNIKNDHYIILINHFRKFVLKKPRNTF